MSLPASVFSYQGVLFFSNRLDVLGCQNVSEHAQTETFLRLEDPAQITATIPRKGLRDCC